MSGIYGYVKNTSFKETVIPELERLGAWNKAYGTNTHLEDKADEYLLGCHIEKLHSEEACPTKFIIRDRKKWVIDAVLYNRDEMYDLLKEFLPPNIEALSDEELLAVLIDNKGLEYLKDVNGDFAGAIYDTDDNSLTLFRDHMGIRPLYYYVSNEFVCFSTDLRGVLSVENVNVSINEQWVYRTYFDLIAYTSTSTEYKYIYCVRPASYLKIKFQDRNIQNKYPSRVFHAKEYDYEVDDTQRDYWKSLNRVLISEKKYWYLGDRRIRCKTEEDYCSKLRSLIEDSVRRRLNAFDGVAGAEFSGGLDSSLISILIKQMGRDCLYCSWSIDPKDYPLVEEDERRTILEICKRYSINCKFLSKDVYFDKFTKLHENTSELVNVDSDEHVLEKYVFWPMINTQHLLNSATYVANGGGKVVFTGHGGDEGVSHRPNPYELVYHKEIGNYINYYRELRENKNFEWLRAIRRTVRALIQSQKALRRNKAKIRECRKYKDEYFQIINSDFLYRGRRIKDIPFTFAYDVKKYILRNGSRNRMDCVAMYGAFCGVRYMFPYLDYRVIDFAVSIERGMYLRHGTNRYILKKAFKDILPQSLLGDVNKFDPSFEYQEVKEASLERKIYAVQDRLKEYIEKYHCSEIEDIFSLVDILEEMNTKEVTEEYIAELMKKCGVVINTARLSVLIEKARNKRDDNAKVR